MEEASRGWVEVKRENRYRAQVQERRASEQVSVKTDKEDVGK